jgi:hypothetical protein
MKTALLSFVVLLCACDAQVSIGDPDAGTPDAGTGVQVIGGCPRVSLGRATTVEYSADTSTLDNIVISSRLEWKEAPDDSLEFTAAQAGNYAIDLTGTNMDLGVSAQEYRTTGLVPFTRSACPPPGLVVSIDGFYNHNHGTVALAEGESMVMFVSAPRWAAEKTGAYTVKVRLVP